MPADSWPRRLANAAAPRSWEWLASLVERLHVTVQLVESDGSSVALPGVIADERIQELLRAGAPPLRNGIGAALRSKSAVPVTVDDIHMSCCAIGTPEALGVLIVSRVAAPAAQPRGELDLIARWLAPAIHAHASARASDESDWLHRVSSLLTLLTTVGPASDRRLIASVADTLAIWHDLELYGYVEREDGSFERQVQLPGVDPLSVPEIIAGRLVPASDSAVILQRVDGTRLGFAAEGDVFLARIGPEGYSWLLVVGARIRPHLLSRLEIYVRLLSASIAVAVAESQAALVMSQLKMLSDAGDLRTNGERALMELNRAIEADASVTVVSAQHATIRIGDSGLRDSEAPAYEAVVTAQASPSVSVTIGVRQPARRHLTPQEHRLVRASAELFVAWARRLTEEPVRRAERRTGGQRFEEVVDRAVRQALQSGVSAAVVVMALAGAEWQPDVLRALIGEVRSILRPSDMAGLLGGREIALVLQDASREKALVVAERVRGALAETRSGGALPNITVGIAVREAGAEAAGTVQEARAGALASDVA